MYWRGRLDLRTIGSAIDWRDLYTAATRAEAVEQCRQRGIHHALIHRAANRFQDFWVIGELKDRREGSVVWWLAGREHGQGLTVTLPSTRSTAPAS